MPGSRDIRELGHFISRYVQGGYHPHFVIQERYREGVSESVEIGSDVIERMIRQGHFSISKITVHLSSKLAVTEISLCLDDVERHSISRFPRSILEDDNYKSGKISFRVLLGSLG